MNETGLVLGEGLPTRLSNGGGCNYDQNHVPFRFQNSTCINRSYTIVTTATAAFSC